MIIIAAMTKERVIGKDNKLLWHISDDLKNFKRLTSGNTVIMGRKTYDSIGKPLPNRNNIVVSRKMEPKKDIEVAKSFEDAVTKAEAHKKDIFVIGGAQIYEQAIIKAEKMYISVVDGEYEGDALFPEIKESEWTLVSTQDYDNFEFCVYRRKR